MNKVLLISGSNRNGCSDHILNEVHKKISSTKYIKLRDYQLDFCKGCLYCDTHKTCVLNDDLAKVVELVLDSDLVVFAISNYFGSMSGFFKNFIDRLHYMYKKNIIDNKKVIFIYTGAGDEKLTLTEMTEATGNIEKYLNLEVLNRYSIQAKNKSDISEDKILEIVDFINSLD